VECLTHTLFYLFGMFSFVIGQEAFLNGVMLLAMFEPHRLADHDWDWHKINDRGLTYHMNVRHVECLSPCGWRNLVTSPADNPTHTHFRKNLFFHPNIQQVGWDDIVKCYYYRLDPEDFHPFPSKPRFWDILEIGLVFRRWPPAIFQPWIKMLEQGIVLELDRMPDQADGAMVMPSSPSPSRSPDFPFLTPSPPGSPLSQVFCLGQEAGLDQFQTQALVSPPASQTPQPGMENGLIDVDDDEEGLWSQVPDIELTGQEFSKLHV
jgi:hypothetical protein